MFVLGIDPGVARCGYGVVEQVGRQARGVDIGVLRTPAGMAQPERLLSLQDGIRALFDRYEPEVLVLERVLLHVDSRTALSVGQASGVAMVEGARRGVEVAEYSPNEVKGAVVGYGSATKAQVQLMVKTLLGLDAPPKPADAADAAAIALCHLARIPTPRRART
ncbi:MAG: crossover junction endodeoxyribonuclease RuvC [Acidimicrobiia bacterium]|nr:crossover junction endodeoxyribonuclease RuvC [Acidimicrobiia bacterium]